MVKKVAILTAGGFAPCLSTAIGALISRYTELAPDVPIIAYRNGYQGLLTGDSLEVTDEAGRHAVADYLPVVLEYTSTQPPKEARAFLNEMAHIFNAIFAALQLRDTRYASVLGALLELAGEKAKPVKVTPDEPIDDSWEEPAVFDGCSTKGQANPNQPQPIHIVRNPNLSTPKPGVTV